MRPLQFAPTGLTGPAAIAAGTIRAVAAMMHGNSIGMRVFSATKARDRDALGETISDWIKAHSDYEVFEKVVLQSSDAEFHCLTIVLIYSY